MKLSSYAKVLLSAVGFGLASAAGAEDRTADDGRMEPSKAMQAVMDDDVKDFFETAASSNQFEIDSSRLAAERVTDPALKTYAQKMIKDHGKAGDELEKLARKKSVMLPTRLLKRHEAMLKDPRNEKPGADFDDEYRDKMISSYKEAVSLFDEAARDSKDADVKAFAAKTLPTLQDHDGLARKLPKPGADS